MTPATDNADAAACGTKRTMDEAFSADTAPSTHHTSTSDVDDTTITTTPFLDESHKIQARREANRQHAFKSRQRNKVLLSELQQTVQQLAAAKSDLERHNAILRAQVEVLQQQNLSLLQNQNQTNSSVSTQQNQMLLQQQQRGGWAPPPQLQQQHQQLSLLQQQHQLQSNTFMAGLSQLAASNPAFFAAVSAMGGGVSLVDSSTTNNSSSHNHHSMSSTTTPQSDTQQQQQPLAESTSLQ
jgi:hypothetical protein